MKIKIQNENDSLKMENDIIKAFSAGKVFEFNIRELQKAMIITTDLGPFYDDMCLALQFKSEATVFIMSGHSEYQAFLFDQLGKSIKLDYEKIISATTCIENNIFVIYENEAL